MTFFFCDFFTCVLVFFAALVSSWILLVGRFVRSVVHSFDGWTEFSFHYFASAHTECVYLVKIRSIRFFFAAAAAVLSLFSSLLWWNIYTILAYVSFSRFFFAFIFPLFFTSSDRAVNWTNKTIAKCRCVLRMCGSLGVIWKWLFALPKGRLCRRNRQWLGSVSFRFVLSYAHKRRFALYILTENFCHNARVSPLVANKWLCVRARLRTTASERARERVSVWTCIKMQ